MRIAFKGAKTSHVWYVKAIVQKKNNTEGGGRTHAPSLFKLISKNANPKETRPLDY